LLLAAGSIMLHTYAHVKMLTLGSAGWHQSAGAAPLLASSSAIMSTRLLLSSCLLFGPAGVQDWAHGWRLSLGLAAVPAFVLLAGGIMLPESPNSLIER
jgi:hypothetical protein